MKRVSCDVLFVWPNLNRGTNSFFGSQESTELFQVALARAGLNLANCKHEVLVDTALEDGVKPPKALVSVGIARVWNVISKLKPKVVVPVGGTSFHAFCPEASLLDWAGRNVTSTLLNSKTLFDVELPPIVPVFHPDHAVAYPMRKREVDSQLVEVSNKVGKFASTISKLSGAVNWRVITEEDELRDELNHLSAPLEWPVAFDFETTGLDPFDEGARIRCMGVCAQPGKAFVVDFESKPSLLKQARDWLLTDTPKLCHNSKFEIKWCRRVLKLHPVALTHDSLLLHHLLFEESSHRLELLAQQHTNIGGYDDEVKLLLERGQTYATMPMDKLWFYCAGDVDATQRIYRELVRLLRLDPNFEQLDWLYRKVVLSTAHALAVLEDNGMHVDVEQAKRVASSLEFELEKKKNKLHELPEVKQAKTLLKQTENEWFNLNSPVQTACLLFDVLKLEGERSTKKERLAELLDSARNDQQRSVLAEVKAIRTLESDLKELNEIVSHVRPDGRINSNYRQDVVVTGRLSSTSPNLQNLRVGGVVRSVFVSRFSGGHVVQADFSQLEVRLLGGVAGDETFINAFAQGQDIHMVTATKLFNKSAEDVTKVERNRAKRVNFGVIFGIGAAKLSRELKVDKEEAQSWLDTFDKSYPAVTKWKALVIAQARRNKRIVTLLGRVRHLPEILHPDDFTRWRAERQAVNTSIQGLGADITAWCFNNVLSEFKLLGLRSVLIGQVHDSIIVDSHPDELHTVAKTLKKVMELWTRERFPFLRIPLKADVTSGPSLLDEKPLVVTKQLSSRGHTTVPF